MSTDTIATPKTREFDLIQRRKYLLVAEWLGSREHGQRSARWMKDLETGAWYMAASWTKRGRRLGSSSAEQIETLIAGQEPVKEERPTNDRDEAIKTMRAALKARSGKTWSVTGGRGTVWGWITIQSPPARQQFGSMSEADRVELGQLLGKEVHHQGESIPAGSDYREEYIARCEGRTPTVHGTPYWD